MKTLEIVFGDSSNNLLKKVNLVNSDILMINMLFNVGDLSNIFNYIIDIPKELCFSKKNYCIKEETYKIIDNINKRNKIRVWSGHRDIYSYLILLYVSSIIKKYNYELYVVYCDEYNKDYPSISVMNEEEIKKLIKLEHKLSIEEIEEYFNIWKRIIDLNTDFRVLEDGIVKSVSLDYYDDYILDTLKDLGKVKICQLIGRLMQEVYLQDALYEYLINRLIDNKKIIIYKDDNSKYCDNFIDINV